MTGDPGSRVRRLTRAVVYAVLVAVPLGLLAFLVRTKFDPLVRFDQDVIRAATDYTRDHPDFSSFVEAWERISQPFVMYLLLGVPVSLYCWFAKDYRTRAWWAMATMAVGWGLATVLKLVVRRARPEIDDPIAQHSGFSFPSGHATNNAIVVTAVLLLVWPLLGTGVRRLLVGLGTAWVVVTCADRLFAGAHFLSDVTAGVLLGCGLTAASYAGYVGWHPPTPTTKKGADR
ncbi:phosphatase PAP2 family protein [Nocardioides dilutus]